MNLKNKLYICDASVDEHIGDIKIYQKDIIFIISNSYHDSLEWIELCFNIEFSKTNKIYYLGKGSKVSDWYFFAKNIQYNENLESIVNLTNNISYKLFINFFDLWENQSTSYFEFYKHVKEISIISPVFGYLKFIDKRNLLLASNSIINILQTINHNNPQQSHDILCFEISVLPLFLTIY